MRNCRDRRAGNKLCAHLTNRLLTGLPFIPTLWMSLLIKGVMARGQTMYPVRICAFLWMGNHYHMVLCGAPEHISDFKNYLHGELGKYIKRLLPAQYQTSVWEPGRGKEQPLKTAEDAIRMIAYIYSNPANAGLVDTIEHYPGVSSWQMFKTETKTFDTHWVPPRVLKPVSGRYSVSRDKNFYLKLKSKAQTKESFILHPHIWAKCYKETADLTTEEVRAIILERVARNELEARNKRKHKVIGKAQLLLTPVDKEHQPKERTRTPFIICHDKELRKECIRQYRIFREAVRQAWHQLRKGVLTAYPRGSCFPGTRRLAWGIAAVREAG